MKILVIAPHPDDEVLGAGGTLFRYQMMGHSTAWLIITEVPEELGWSHEKIKKREDEISHISKLFSFEEVYNLRLPTARLDTLPFLEIVQKISKVIETFKPDEILIPHFGDAHTDHQIVHKAALCCAKWFRHPSIIRVLVYETISETNFGLGREGVFNPNVFIDISDFLEKKVAAMEVYSSEIGSFPFPRSKIAIESLARYRGSSAGYCAAEAFQLLC
ncbi:thiol_BshB1, bacillithiol biosynthesis deacetylase BshB1 [Burkholderiaceae bacterium]